jgi:hypothetical protein
MAELEPGAASLFGAVLRRQRSRWRQWLAVGVLGFVAAVAFARRNAGQYRVMTPGGFRVLKAGMSTSDVRSVIGSGPIAHTHPDGGDCLIYGHPTLKQADFLVYEACYEQGALLGVHEREYSAQTIDPDELRRLVRPEPPAAPAVP